jgi:hypothetical protein
MKGIKEIKKGVNDEDVKEMIPCQISPVFSTTVNSLLSVYRLFAMCINCKNIKVLKY